MREKRSFSFSFSSSFLFRDFFKVPAALPRVCARSKMPCPLEKAGTDPRVLAAIASLNQGHSDIEMMHVFEFDASNPKSNSARVAEVGKILQSLDSATDQNVTSSNENGELLVVNNTKKLYEAAWKAVLLPQLAEENLYSLNKNVDGFVLDVASCLALTCTPFSVA